MPQFIYPYSFIDRHLSCFYLLAIGKVHMWISCSHLFSILKRIFHLSNSNAVGFWGNWHLGPLVHSHHWWNCQGKTVSSADVILGKHSATELTTLLVLGKRTYMPMENRKEGPLPFQLTESHTLLALHVKGFNSVYMSAASLPIDQFRTELIPYSRPLESFLNYKTSWLKGITV